MSSSSRTSWNLPVMKSKINVVKVGGAVVEDDASLSALLDRVAALAEPTVLVHGGGRSATALARKLGIEPVMIDGRRVTDSDMLDVVTMVYGGLVNKKIVASLQSRGVNAVGLTGADMNLIVSDMRPKHPIDFGYVGDVRQVNADALDLLIANGFFPVVAPLTHDGHGNILNTNADTIASSVACGLADKHDVTLVYCFEMDGVLADANDISSVISEITPDSYQQLKNDGIVSGGMIPKLDNAFSALAKGVSRVVITKATALGDSTKGTTIKI